MDCYETDCEWFDLSKREAGLIEAYGFEPICYEVNGRDHYCVAVEQHQVATIIALLS